MTFTPAFFFSMEMYHWMFIHVQSYIHVDDKAHGLDWGERWEEEGNKRIRKLKTLTYRLHTFILWNRRWRPTQKWQYMYMYSLVPSADKIEGKKFCAHPATSSNRVLTHSLVKWDTIVWAYQHDQSDCLVHCPDSQLANFGAPKETDDVINTYNYWPPYANRPQFS